MIKVKKSYTDYCYECFYIKTEEGTFKIYRDYNLNLCWSPVIDDEISNDYFEYTITKDNKYVYKLFDELYCSIIEKKPFKYCRYDAEDSVFDEIDCELVQDGVIEWHSDCFEYDAASILKIDKNSNDDYVIAFKKSKIVSDDVSPFSTFAVCINSGISRYNPYNDTFIDMYNKFKGYDIFPFVE